MAVYDKLKEEFGCAIAAVLGDLADQEYCEGKQEYCEGKVDELDLNLIANKVKFYLDL